MRLAESFYGQTSTRQKSGARGLCVYYIKLAISDIIMMTFLLARVTAHSVSRAIINSVHLVI